jgi:hypothetical protein
MHVTGKCYTNQLLGVSALTLGTASLNKHTRGGYLLQPVFSRPGFSDSLVGHGRRRGRDFILRGGLAWVLRGRREERGGGRRLRRR